MLNFFPCNNATIVTFLCTLLGFTKSDFPLKKKSCKTFFPPLMLNIDFCNLLAQIFASEKRALKYLIKHTLIKNNRLHQLFFFNKYIVLGKMPKFSLIIPRVPLTESRRINLILYECKFQTRTEWSKQFCVFFFCHL